MSTFETQIKSDVGELQAKVTLMEGRFKFLEQVRENAGQLVLLSCEACSSDTRGGRRARRTLLQNLLLRLRNRRHRVELLRESHAPRPAS